MAVFQCVLMGFVNGQTFNHVMHVKDDNVDATTKSDLANLLNVQWVQRIRGLQTNGVQYTQITVRNVSIPLDPVFSLPINILGTGGAAAAEDGPVPAALLRFSTAVAGRTGQGRYYMPGLNMNTSTNLGQLTPATLTSWQVLLDDMKTQWLEPNLNNIALGICSRGNPTATFKNVIDMRFRTILSTMRSRNWGVGI